MAFLLGECLLPYWLEKRGMTKAEFARRMGYSRSHISKLIATNGTRSKMSLEFAINAAHLLECKVTDLYVMKTGKR